MASKTTPLVTSTKSELVITRVLNAPRDIVFNLWTEPRHLARWWGPKGFTSPVCNADVQPGGKLYIDMKAPDGTVYPMTGTFEEIIPGEKLVFTTNALDEYGTPDLIVRNTISFSETAGKTTLTIHAQVSKVTRAGQQHLRGMQEGWNQSLDRLFNQLLTSETLDRELVISRLLDAPRELVFDVWTHPDHIKNWWGPNGFTNTIHKMEVKPGGEWEFVMHGPDGKDYKNTSVFREIVRPERIVFDHISGPKFRTTVLFEDYGQKTLLTWRMVFESREQFERTVKAAGAEEGLKQTIEKFNQYLQSR